jgi:hypothetical protein
MGSAADPVVSCLVADLFAEHTGVIEGEAIALLAQLRDVDPVVLVLAEPDAGLRFGEVHLNTLGTTGRAKMN